MIFDWLLTSTSIPVSTWVWVIVGILLSGVVCYALYRLLLGRLVEHGEWHPANLRRFLWGLYLLFVELILILLLNPYLERPAAYIVLTLIAVVVIGILLFTKKRV